MVSPDSDEYRGPISSEMPGVACAYFIRASIDCPASSTAQGASIALSTLESGLSPDYIEKCVTCR